MSSEAPVDRCSKVFLSCWIGLPILSYFVTQFFWTYPNSFVAMHFVALFLAIFCFPFVLRRMGQVSKVEVLRHLLYLLPVYIALGKLHGAGWRTGVEFLFLGVVLGAEAFLRDMEIKGYWKAWPAFGLLSLIFSFLLPLSIYIARDQGGKDWGVYSSISPFVFSVRLLEGGGYEAGIVFFVALLALLFLWHRRVQAKQEVA